VTETVSSPVWPDRGPGLDRPGLHGLYRGMVLARTAEERLELLQRQGHVTGGLYRCLGQEAIGVGTAYALRRRQDGTGDLIGQSIRNIGAVFLFGGTPENYFRQYLARGTAPTRGKEANVHWSDFDRGLVGPVSPLGTMVEVLAGITLSFRMRGEDRVGLVYYGDGATSTGAWHEGLNFAAVRRCPLVVVVEANGYAFSTPTGKQTRLESFAEKAEGYGVAGESVDGNDVLAVYEATRRSAERARGGEGVTLLECRTYRRRGHAQHDNQEYVPEGEIEAWEERDPIDRFRTRLLEEGWATETELDEIVRESEERVRQAAEKALAEPAPEPEWARKGVYGDRDAPVPWTRLPEPDPRTIVGGGGRR